MTLGPLAEALMRQSKNVSKPGVRPAAPPPAATAAVEIYAQALREVMLSLGADENTAEVAVNAFRLGVIWATHSQSASVPEDPGET